MALGKYASLYLYGKTAQESSGGGLVLEFPATADTEKIFSNRFKDVIGEANDKLSLTNISPAITNAATSQITPPSTNILSPFSLGTNSTGSISPEINADYQGAVSNAAPSIFDSYKKYLEQLSIIKSLRDSVVQAQP